MQQLPPSSVRTGDDSLEGIVAGPLKAGPSLELHGISKRFGRVQANDAIDAVFRPGEIHGLLGENGAGKSTLVKIVSGIHAPDAGEIKVKSDVVKIDSPADARAAGIAVVHQSSTLVPALTIAENAALVLGGLGRVDPAIARRLVETARALGFELDPNARIRDLSPGNRQRAEIVRALTHEASVILLDEPTAVLAPQERSELFTLLRQLAGSGAAVVLVTHRLEEALTQCDRLTVLRRGKVVGASLDPGSLGEADLIQMLVGELHPAKRASRPVGEVVLRATNLQGAPPGGHHLHGITLEVRASEVLGVAGVEGNGQRELAAALVGSWRPDIGRVELRGQLIDDYAAQQRADLIADVPDDDALALVHLMSVWQNLALDRLTWHEALTPWSKRRLRRRATELVESFEIRTPSVDAPVGWLSGGNRRRVVVARELSKQPQLVVACFATKGLDVRSTEQVKGWVSRLAESGAAVVYIASELEELFDVSHRIAVLARGRISGTVDAGSTDVQEIGRLMLAAVDGD